MVKAHGRGGSGDHYNSPIAPVDVLVLCTANQCRSPMGQVLLQHRLSAAGIDAHVHSAGLMAGGVAASDGGARAMAKRGLDLAPHRSRTLTREMLAHADLVLGMAREHVREAVALEPTVFHRTFTLREAVRRAQATGPRLPGPDGAVEPLDAWLRRLGEGRRATDLLGNDPADDVADPMGQSRRAYERCAADLEALADQLVTLAFPVGGLSRTYSA